MLVESIPIKKQLLKDLEEEVLNVQKLWQSGDGDS